MFESLYFVYILCDFVYKIIYSDRAWIFWKDVMIERVSFKSVTIVPSYFNLVCSYAANNTMFTIFGTSK